MADVIRNDFENPLDSRAWSIGCNTSKISLHHCLPNLLQSATDFSISEISTACTWKISKKKEKEMYVSYRI